MISPCKDCDLREPGCHASCDGYINWKKSREIGAAERQKERDGRPEIARSIVRKIWKYKNRK